MSAAVDRLAPSTQFGTAATALQRLFSTQLADASVGFGLVLLWMYAHAYIGIEGDSKIYMGRVLADLYPQGVGRDLMFAHDGQSAFSLYGFVARGMTEMMGLSPASAVLSIANMIVRFLAITAFVRCVARERAFAVVLAAVCVLPTIYTPWHLIGAGEGIAVPRALAEAATLFALAALCKEHYVRAVAWLAVGAVFHPIMVAPGCAVVLVVLGLKDRRWFVAAGAGLVVILLAGLCGVPLASRLFVTIDTAWDAILLERNPYLFLHLWPRDTFGSQLVQVVTVVIGAGFVAPHVRRILYAAIAVAVIFCGISLIFADGLADLLIVQAQLWRALWLVAVLAPVGAGLCLAHLLQRGVLGQVTLAALCAAWITLDDFPVAPALALFAAGLWWVGNRRSIPLSRPSVVAAWTLVILYTALTEWSSLSVVEKILSRVPDGLGFQWTVPWTLLMAFIPVMLFIIAWRTWPTSALTRIAAPVLILVGLILFPVAWDVRTPGRRDLDAATLKPDLAALLATRPGEVLWLEGDEVWFWAHRGNWNGLTQGGSIVFSRDLAMTWHDRTLAMIAHGLGTTNMLNPWEHSPSLLEPKLDHADVGAFCQREDAPAWIVSPLGPDQSLPQGLEARAWSPHVPTWKFAVSTGDVRWLPHDHYAIIPCGGKQA